MVKFNLLTYKELFVCLLELVKSKMNNTYDTYNVTKEKWVDVDGDKNTCNIMLYTGDDVVFFDYYGDIDFTKPVQIFINKVDDERIESDLEVDCADGWVDCMGEDFRKDLEKVYTEVFMTRSEEILSKI